MNRYKSMENREQISLMPICMVDMISTDCEVRANRCHRLQDGYSIHRFYIFRN